MDTPVPPAWNVFQATCPTRTILECISDKWAVLVVGLLMGGTRRFGELRRGIEGVSQKMLTQTLRALERDGLVRRKVFAAVPPKVEYTLTPLGHSLAHLVDALRIWAEANVDQVLQSRDLYDREGAEAG